MIKLILLISFGGAIELSLFLLEFGIFSFLQIGVIVSLTIFASILTIIKLLGKSKC
jgi:hypothetical protein